MSIPPIFDAIVVHVCRAIVDLPAWRYVPISLIPSLLYREKFVTEEKAMFDGVQAPDF